MTMKIIIRTSSTSIIGVMLMSDLGPPPPPPTAIDIESLLHSRTFLRGRPIRESEAGPAPATGPENPRMLLRLAPGNCGGSSGSRIRARLGQIGRAHV